MRSEVVRRARVAKGWTQRQLAEQVPTTAMVIVRMERGGELFYAATIARVAAALGVPASKLLA